MNTQNAVVSLIAVGIGLYLADRAGLVAPLNPLWGGPRRVLDTRAPLAGQLETRPIPNRRGAGGGGVSGNKAWWDVTAGPVKL